MWSEKVRSESMCLCLSWRAFICFRHIGTEWERIESVTTRQLHTKRADREVGSRFGRCSRWTKCSLCLCLLHICYGSSMAELISRWKVCPKKYGLLGVEGRRWIARLTSSPLTYCFLRIKNLPLNGDFWGVDRCTWKGCDTEHCDWPPHQVANQGAESHRPSTFCARINLRTMVSELIVARKRNDWEKLQT